MILKTQVSYLLSIWGGKESDWATELEIGLQKTLKPAILKYRF